MNLQQVKEFQERLIENPMITYRDELVIFIILIFGIIILLPMIEKIKRTGVWFFYLIGIAAVACVLLSIAQWSYYGVYDGLPEETREAISRIRGISFVLAYFVLHFSIYIVENLIIPLAEKKEKRKEEEGKEKRKKKQIEVGMINAKNKEIESEKHRELERVKAPYLMKINALNQELRAIPEASAEEENRYYNLINELGKFEQIVNKKKWAKLKTTDEEKFVFRNSQ